MYVSMAEAQMDLNNLRQWLWANEAYVAELVDRDLLLATGDGLGLDIDITQGIDPTTVFTSGSSPVPTPTTPTGFIGTLNSIADTIDSAVSRGAMSAQNYYAAKMKIDAMRAQSGAGFLASPVVIPTGGASIGGAGIPTPVLLGGAALLLVALMAGKK